MNFKIFEEGIKREVLKDLEPIRNFSHKLGLSVSFTPEKQLKNGISYSAQAGLFKIPLESKIEAQISNLAHELGHYIVAMPEDRKKDNFGLGPSPDDEMSSYWMAENDGQSSLNYRSLVSNTVSHEIETKASMAGLILEYLLGYSPLFTYVHHGWDTQDSKGASLETVFNLVIKDVQTFYQTVTGIQIE